MVEKIDMEEKDEAHPVQKFVVVLISIASVIFSGWCTIIAFIGGTLPIIGIHLQGGILTGLLWLFIIDPIVITVCYWIGMIIFVPVALIFKKE